MIDCEKASTLALASQNRALSVLERIRLALHRMVCAPCRFYRRQLEAMRVVAAELDHDGDNNDTGLADNARERIRQRLRAARDDQA